jgi:hypothetical protein
MYSILYTGDQYLVFGGAADLGEQHGLGVALYGSSISAMTAVAPLTGPNQGNFFPAGEPLNGFPYEITGLVSNGTVTVGLGSPGLFETTDGITWNYESLDGVVPATPYCATATGAPCIIFASGAAAPGGPIVVLTYSNSGAETTDGVHWVKSNL